MSGISTEDGKHSLTACGVRHSGNWVFCFLVLMSFSSWTVRHLFVEHVASHDSYDLTRSTFMNLPTWTGIECQLDMPRGDDKSYTSICDAAVIARFCCKRRTGSERGRLWRRVRTGVRPWRALLFWEAVLCLRSTRFPNVP